MIILSTFLKSSFNLLSNNIKHTGTVKEKSLSRQFFDDDVGEDIFHFLTKYDPN